ncbi:MAG TPA: heavy metal translocating P-type ATPase, partial [Bacillota bacterium]|nr:heavy metal translocating P-type ATPase [Bacillota bacterium]
MRYRLKGLDCPDCAAKLEREIQQQAGLPEAAINFNTLTIELPIEWEQPVREIIARVEPHVSLIAAETLPDNAVENEVENKRQLIVITVAGLLFWFGLIFHDRLHRTAYNWAEYLVLLTSYFLVGWPVIRNAARRIIRRDLFDENFLMTIATLGAISLHQLPEAAGVMVFYAVGEYLQSRAVNRSRRSIAALLNIQPEYANLKENGILTQVMPREIQVGAT